MLVLFFKGGEKSYSTKASVLFKTKEDYGMLKEARRLGTLPAPGLDPILEEIIKDIITGSTVNIEIHTVN